MRISSFHLKSSLTSVTRLGNFLGNHSEPAATPKLLTLLGNFCKGVKIIYFSCEIIFGNFYRHLAIFIWSHCPWHNKSTFLHLALGTRGYLFGLKFLLHTNTLTWELCHSSKVTTNGSYKVTFSTYFCILKNLNSIGLTRPIFVYFCPFLNTLTDIVNKIRL